MLLPSPHEIDARARRIAAYAAGARATARRLEHDTGGARWRGAAATAFAASTAETASALRRAADRLDDAALALHRHARAVEHVVEAVRGLAARTGRAVDDVIGTLAVDARSVGSGLVHAVG